MTRRRGWSLIEVTVTVSLTSVLLAATAVMLTTLFRSQTQTRGDLEQQQTLARLNLLFRADAHAADAAETTQGCRLTRADGRTVGYAWQPPRLVREIQQGGKLEHRDEFVLSTQAEVNFTLIDRSGRQFARLEITPADVPPQGYAAPVRSAEIDALVGLHRQLAEARP